ncbi:MAG: FtsX-like permease family protein [Gemmataceae bacterium]
MSPAALAWHNITHKRGRTAIAVAGVAFAVVLVFMELGLYDGVGRTAAMLYDALRFDLLLVSSEYVDVSRTGDFPRARLAQARAAPDVTDAVPVSMGIGTWRMPARRDLLGRTVPAGGTRSISILGVPPDRIADVFAVDRGRVFRSPTEAARAGKLLTGPDAVLYDTRSKPEFGRLADLIDVPPAGDPATGTVLRYNGRRVDVVGGFALGTGFSWNAMILTAEPTFAALTYLPADRVTFGLVSLEPGTDPDAAAVTLRAALPADVRVMTRPEIEAHENRHWMRLTSIGQFLLVAVVLAVVVGVIFVYQMMAADIRAMLPEYATVKALGYRPPFLGGVVLAQAAFLAVLGFVPGYAAAVGLYAVARTVGGIPTEMTASRAAVVLGLTGGMCLGSGLLAVRKVHAADPADLFA